MPASATSKKDRVRTTVRLPRPLYNEAKSYLGKDVSPADNINDFFVAAICNYVKLLRRRRIDAAFASIADDADYQKEAKLIAEEFAPSDWEALRSAEKHRR